ncbi:hypothetical protein PLESTB_000787900 [Pleodorina starrii]|uniref:Protein kinase domain-containing protein n=1 Tax=Pleodorina starrii TaxID=330485 RepID=A0A9W6BKQ5_9CHLO|nr:hypothetical protein PLESTB_000787900 [Pleodorina starrii]
MLSCLCLPCMGDSPPKASSAAGTRERHAQASISASSSAGRAPGVTTAGISTDAAEADSVGRKPSSAPVDAASGLVPGSANTVYMPACSPFATPQSLGGGTDAGPGFFVAQKAGADQQPPPKPPPAGSAGLDLSNFATPAHKLNTTTTPSFDSHTKLSASTAQQAVPPAGTSSAIASTATTAPHPPPAFLLPGHLFLIQQATSSGQSATGSGTATNSTTGLNAAPGVLPGNAAPGVLPGNAVATASTAILTTTTTSATLRSEAGTEATVRLLPAGGGDASAALPSPALILTSDVSSARLVDYLHTASVDTQSAAGHAVGATGGSGSAAARPAGSATALGSAAGGIASAALGASGSFGRRVGGPLRSGPVGPSPNAAPSGSSFSLFGALQAFVEQRQQGDAAAAPPSASFSPLGAGPKAQGQGLQGQGAPGTGDQFRGFDRFSTADDSQDAPTATLSRVRSGTQATHGSGALSRLAGEGSRSRRRTGGWGDGGALPYSPLGPGYGSRSGQARGDPERSNGNNHHNHNHNNNHRNRRGSGEWSQARSSAGPDSGTHDACVLTTGIIIGGACLATNSSSANVCMSGPWAGSQAAAAAAAAAAGAAPAESSVPESSRTSNGAMRDFDRGSAMDYGHPLSAGPHSFDGMASLLSGINTHTNFLDDTYRGGGGGGGGLAGGLASGPGAAGSDGENGGSSCTDAALAMHHGAAAGPRGGGGRSSRQHGMRCTAERREFLSAARNISSVLQDVQILSVLGAGAHGKVYKGALRDRFVAVKVIIHDTEARSVIPASSLTGLHHVPSNTSLTTLGGGGGLLSDPVPPPASETAALGLDTSEPMLVAAAAGGAAGGGGGIAAGSLGSGGRRGTSGSGARPAVHALRFQRAGSSNLHALPATLSGGGGGGGSQVAAAGPGGLPVLSLPGMPPVVMPHKHMLEGLISASAQHPNIVETYRIVTQLLSAPTMPAFVVTRGSQSPLWETTNLNPMAVLRFANGSVGGDAGGGGGVQPRSAAAEAAGAGAGAGQGQPHGSAASAICSSPQPSSCPGGGSSARERLLRASSLGRREGREGGSRSSQTRLPLSASPLSQGRSPGGEAEQGGGGSAAAAAVAAAAAAELALAPRLPASGASDAPLDFHRRRSSGPDAADGSDATCAAPSGDGWLGGAVAARQVAADGGGGAPKPNARDLGLDLTKLCRGAGGGGSPGLDGSRAGCGCGSGSGGAQGHPSGHAGGAGTGACSGTLRGSEIPTLSGSALVRSDGSTERPAAAGSNTTAGGEEGGDPHRASAADSPFTAEAISTGSSGHMRQMVPAAVAFSAAAPAPPPELSSLAMSGGGGGCSSIMSTGGAAALSVSDLAQETRAASASAECAGRSGGSTSSPAAAGSRGAGADGPAAAAVALQLAPGRCGGGDCATEEAWPGGGGGGGSCQAEPDPDSAELILDLLGAQAAAQRTTSFLQRRRQQQSGQMQQQQQQQQHGGSLGCGEGRGGGPAVPGGPAAARWCLDVGVDDGMAVGGAEGGGEEEREEEEGGIGGLVLRRGGGGAARPPGAASEVASGPSGELHNAVHPYDYMVADDSGLMLPHADNFGLATALFSTFRQSYAPTENGSVSGRPLPYRLQHMRGSQSSVGFSIGVGGAFYGPGGIGGGAGAGGGAFVVGGVKPAVSAGAAGGAAHPADPGPAAQEASRDLEPAQHVDSAGSFPSAAYAEASLALPPPLQPSAVAAAVAAATSSPNPTAVNSAAATTTWLPTIDELTAGVGAEALQQQQPQQQLNPFVGPLLLASSGSTARNSLNRAGSMGSGEHGTAASGGAAAGANRTSAGSAASGGAGAGVNARLMLGSTTASNYGGQLMPADVQYDKLSWSNNTHTSASTSAMMVNSGFTALLSSLNTMATGGGSNPGAGGGHGLRRGDSAGMAALSVPRVRKEEGGEGAGGWERRGVAGSGGVWWE